MNWIDKTKPAISKLEISGDIHTIKPFRLPAFLKNVLKLRREGKVWGLKTFLHLLCKPLVDCWLKAQKSWMELADRIGPLVPALESPD